MHATPTRAKDERSVTPSTTAHGWDYGPARVSTTVEIAPRHDLFIGGKNIAPKSRRFVDATNPSTGEPLTRIASAGERDVDTAVTSARAAQSKWAALPATVRARFLHRLGRGLRDHAAELAVLETMDTGRPVRVTRAEDLPLATRQFMYFAGWCDKLGYAAHPVTQAARRAGRGPKPIGVCGLVLSSGRPLLSLACALAPALAGGNTCVIKPSGSTSLTTLRLAEILRDIELPPGVVNIVTGDAATGQHLVGHADVDKIHFVGSAEVGHAVARTCAESEKPHALHLHSTISHVVFADAAVNQAVDAIVAALSTGQTPAGGSASRVLVEESIQSAFISRLTQRLRTVRVGDPLDRNTDVGPLASAEMLAAVRQQIDDARAEGVAVEEGVFTNDTPENGAWCPTVMMTGVQPSHSIAQIPLAGPVLAIMSFRTPSEAMQRVNHSRGGLAVGIWSDKGAKVLALARGLRTGVVWCNGAGRLDAASPFGGRGDAGGSRIGGAAGLREFLAS